MRSEAGSSAWMLICTWSRPAALAALPPGREAKGARNEVGIQTEISGAGHKLYKVAALERLTAREVKLQDAELPRFG